MTDIDAIRKTKRYRWNHDAMWCLQGTEVNLSLIAQWMKATDFDSLLSAYDAKCEELAQARQDRNHAQMAEERFRSKCEELEAERDAAVRDAQRYRWSREHGAWESEAWLSSATPEQIDEHIDAQLAALAPSTEQPKAEQGACPVLP